MRSMAKPFIIFVERFYPDPFVFAIALTFVVYLMALVLTDATPIEALSAWGGGLALLLEFIAQIAITLITAHALAHTDPAQRLLSETARSTWSWPVTVVARDQHGAVARHQAPDAGVPLSAFDARVRREAWPLLHRTVRLLPGTAPTHRTHVSAELLEGGVGVRV